MDGNILIRQLLFLPDYKSYYFTFSWRDGGGIKLPTQPRGLLKDDVDILFTTGGTGIGSRDITPDVIGPLLTMELPGIMDLVRLKYGENNPGALLSRSIAGTINKTLVFALPGSVNAVKEYTEEIVKILEHSIFMLYDISQH